MVKIIKRKNLQGAEKFGSCASCSAGSDKKEIYKLEFEDSHSNRISMSLCRDCMRELSIMITQNELKHTCNNRDNAFCTNAVCPKCGGDLFTSSDYGYSFYCHECNENLNSYEIEDINQSQILTIRVPMTQEDFEDNSEKLHEIAEVYGCDFFSHDDCDNSLSIGWDVYKENETPEHIPNDIIFHETVKQLGRLCKKTLKNHAKIDISENDWNPVSTGYPEDEEDVQITFIGYNDHRPHCEAFAYRHKGEWHWSLNNDEVRVEVIAWKRKCEPYTALANMNMKKYYKGEED